MHHSTFQHPIYSTTPHKTQPSTRKPTQPPPPPLSFCTPQYFTTPLPAPPNSPSSNFPLIFFESSLQFSGSFESHFTVSYTTDLFPPLQIIAFITSSTTIPGHQLPPPNLYHSLPTPPSTPKNTHVSHRKDPTYHKPTATIIANRPAYHADLYIKPRSILTQGPIVQSIAPLLLGRYAWGSMVT